MDTLARRLVLIAGLLAGTTMIGTLGFWLSERWPIFDAFYMSLITLTTVGYGEIHPLSVHGRVFASFFMVTGVTVVFLSIAILGDSVIQLEKTDYFRGRRRNRMLKDISGHFIVCGAGRVGQNVVRGLLASGAKVVLIDDNPEHTRWGDELGVVTMTEDATKDETLRRARIDTAAGLVAAIGTDAENVYVTLSARVLNPSLKIAARATDEQSVEKLRRAGATTVLTPYSFIGHRLAQSMVRPHVSSFLDVASAFGKSDLEIEIEIEELQIAPNSFLASTTLDKAHLGRNYGVIVLAVQRQDGKMQFNPQADLTLEAGDVLIAMGERQKLKRLELESTGR